MTLWKVGIDQSPASPTTSMVMVCQGESKESSPLKELSVELVSTFPFSIVEREKLKTQRVASAGRMMPAANADGVTTSRTHSMSEVMSPMTVKAPPRLAATRIVQAYMIFCVWFDTILHMMVIMSTTVVRLSTLAETRKVRADKSQRKRLPLRIRSHLVRGSNTPLLFITSTIVLVAIRNKMT